MVTTPPWLDGLDARDRALVVAGEQPPRIDPQLAVPGRAVSMAGAVHERKLDGMRFIAYVRDGEVELRTRTYEERSRGFPELVDALRACGHDDVVLDGEVVAFDGGSTSFSRLQGRIGLNDPVRARLTGIEVHLYLFDVLHLDGYDLRKLPLVVRKRLLRDEVTIVEPVRFTEHVEGDAARLLVDACARGWEGLIAKEPSAPYRSGRSTAWRKLKCSRDGEFVICGWTEPRGARTGFGALLLGYLDEPAEEAGSAAGQGGSMRFRYAGKVGTGFSQAFLERLAAELPRLEIADPPFVDPPRERGARWMDPCLVARIAYAEWTPDGRLRHPRFVGLRPDRRPQDVVGRQADS